MILTDSEEVLFRHIRFSLLHDGQPQSLAFVPLPKDKNLLSVDRGSMMTPRESYRLFTDNGFDCARVYGISVGEFAGEKIVCRPDPLPSSDAMPRPNPADAVADFSPHNASQQKLIAKRLKRRALSRGCLYIAP
jgi:hypothetical protein